MSLKNPLLSLCFYPVKFPLHPHRMHYFLAELVLPFKSYYSFLATLV